MASDQRPDTDDGGAWLRRLDGAQAIRARSVIRYLENGGQLIAVRLVEDADVFYSVWLRLADRPGEFRLNQFHVDQPKTFKDVARAIAFLRNDFRYFGVICVATDRRQATPGRSLDPMA